jgi:hypothetical protein
MTAIRTAHVRDRIDRFLFCSVDARAAAWLRIVFAIAIPYFFWSSGLIALSALPVQIRPLYTEFVETHWYTVVVVGLCVLLAAGIRSRLVTLILLGVLAPSAFLSQGHTSRVVLLVALAAFALVPSDTVRAPWRTPPGDSSTAGPAWPIRVIQLELSLLYGFNALAKTTPAYLRGDVLEAMSVALPNFKIDMSGGTVDLGILAIPVVLAAVATVAAEYFLAVAFWFRRLKWIAAIVGIVFHWLLTLVVQIYKLNLVSIFLYASFVLPLIRSEPADGQTPSGRAARLTRRK